MEITPDGAINLYRLMEQITSSPTTGFSCWDQLRSKPAMGVTVFQRTQVAELSMLSTRSHDEK